MVLFRRIPAFSHTLNGYRLLLTPTQSDGTSVVTESPDRTTNRYTGHLTVPLSSQSPTGKVVETTTVKIASDSGITVTGIHPAPESDLPARNTPTHPTPERDPNRPEKETIHPTPTVLDQEVEVPGLRIELTVEPADDSFSDSRPKVTVQPETGYSTTAFVPVAQSLTYLEYLVTGEETQSLVDQVIEYYNEQSEKLSLIECLRDARYVLEFPAYLFVMNRLGEYSDSYRHEFATNAALFFKNMLLHNKYYYITNEEEFEHRLKLHNQYENLATVDRGEVQNRYLEAFASESNSATSPSDFGFSKDITLGLSSSSFLSTIANTLREGDGDTIAAARHKINSNDARSGSADRQYEDDTFETAKQAAKNRPAVKRASAFRKLVPEAARRSSAEFEYILGNYLYWQAATEEYDPSIKHRLFGAAAILFSRRNLGLMRQKANFRQRIAESTVKRHNEGNSAALYMVSKAEDIAKNESGNWSLELSNLYARASRDSTLLHRNMLVDSGNLAGAVNRVQNGFEEVAAIEGVDDRFHMILLAHLAGNKHEAQAMRFEEDDELLAAKEEYEQAWKEFDRAGKNSRCESVQRRHKEIIERIDAEEPKEAYIEQKRREARESSRDIASQAKFRTSLLNAYGKRCVFCGAARQTPDGRPEVQASHIKPVGEGGPDIVPNGFPLCRLHHWAFDNGWITLHPKKEHFEIEVRAASDTPGYSEFAPLDGEPIRTPDYPHQRPSRKFIHYHRQDNGFTDVRPETTIEATEDEAIEQTSVAPDAELADEADSDHRVQTVGVAQRSSKRIFEGDIQGSRNHLINNNM